LLSGPSSHLLGSTTEIEDRHRCRAPLPERGTLHQSGSAKMSNPLVSIITPTGLTTEGKDRSSFWPQIYQCFRAQTYPKIEWVVLDNAPRSARPEWASEPNVKYLDPRGPMTIGAKRNKLCCQAAGEIIVAFDDDDYYAPHYVEQMVSLLKKDEADLAKLYGFYQHDVRDKTFGYWDRSGIDSEGRYDTLCQTDLLGFAFSYVFYKSVWDAVRFEDRDWGEDHIFMERAVEKFRLTGIQDRNWYSCLHILHGNNISRSYFPEMLPSDRLLELFPNFSPPSDVGS
jgi:glycosyltransferase involved in cell wall biosynthesis